MADQIQDPVLVHKHLTKQTDIDRLLEQINRKFLRNTHLPGSLIDLEAAYLNSPYCRDIYIYIQQNRILSNKRLAKRREIQVNNYLLLDKLLFKLMPNSMGIYILLLCIPSSKVELLLH